MTARDIVNHTLIFNKRLKGFDDISDFGVDVLVDMINKYAKQMCDRQREICAESIRLDIVPDKYSLTGKVTIPCKDSITNAPYPEELNT